jgi:class 3 adenylate cyclase
MNEQLLAEKLGALASVPGVAAEIAVALGVIVRTAPDDAVVRINPMRFASEHAFAAAAVVDLFLHARKLGLFTMEWQYVCPGCGQIIERLSSLAQASAHAFCQVCSTVCDADLSDFVEVTFSVSPELRQSRYHDPWSLGPDEHFFNYRFTQSAVVDDGSPLRDHLRRCAVACAYVEPHAMQSFQFLAEPRFLWLTSGPALVVAPTRTDECRVLELAYTGAHADAYRADIAAGPVRIEFTNATSEWHALMITSLPDHYTLSMTPFLSGTRLLSNQTFRELFGMETIASGEGLAVKRLTLVFTDLKGSTALYDRIGDMKAFELVRQHFGHLQDCIARNAGALVKTIGDAIMATFVDPRDGLRAALDMRARIARFNADAGGDLLGIKIGLHTGACLAVTLNDRIDYFGQTVNIAARVQRLAGAGEILFTDDVLAGQDAAELLADLPIASGDVQLQGILGQIRVHRVQAAPA